MGEAHRIQHQQRMAWMPWLYHRAKPEIRAWAQPWQRSIQQALVDLEAVALGEDCFVAPCARIFAEPHREVLLGDRSSIAAECLVHGPVRLGRNVSINPRCTLSGGRAGIEVGDGSRIATGCHLFAWDHGTAPDRPVHEQPTRSRGIRIGADVWIGAGAGITDGVTVGDHAVVGMHAVVTRDVPPWAIVAGNPARPIGDRRDAKPTS